MSADEYRRWLNDYRRECPDLTGRSTLAPSKAERTGTRPFDLLPLDAHLIRHRNRSCKLWRFLRRKDQ